MSQSVKAQRGGVRARFAGGLVRLVGTVGLLGLALALVDLTDLRARLSSLQPRWLLLAAALSLPLYLLMGARWWLVANRLGAALPLRRAVAEYYVSTFLNRVLPISIAGDVFRVVRHHRAVGEARPVAPVIAAAVIDRAAGQSAVALVMAIAALTWTARGHGEVAPLAIGGAAALVAACLVALAIGRRRYRSVAAQELVAAARTLLSPRPLAALAALSLAIVAALMATFYCAGRAADVPLDGAAVLMVAPLVLGATVIPLAFGGWGVREVTTAALFDVLGLPPAAGVVAAVAFGLVGLVTALPGAGVLAWQSARTAARLDERPRRLAFAGAMIACCALTAITGQAEWLALGGAGVLALRGAAEWRDGAPRAGFGAANAITTLRGASAFALFLAAPSLDRIVLVAAVLALLALDGLDGWVARRRGEASAFGAWLDLEVDAFFVATLCLQLWLERAVGAWILVGALWRYVYVLVTSAVPGLAAGPRHRLGRAAFVAFLLSLVGALAVTAPLTAPLAATGTALVSLSFLRSLAWSVRNRTTG